jgi:hypothetical protein
VNGNGQLHHAAKLTAQTFGRQIEVMEPGDNTALKNATLAEASSSLATANETGTAAEAYAAFREFARVFADRYGPTASGGVDSPGHGTR